MIVKDETCIADDIEVENVSAIDSRPSGNGRVEQKFDSNNACNDEDDYEDMVTPTDDEGITNLNHTQKIPISLIKAKDKASKLF